MTLRIATEFELRHQRQSHWPSALRVYRTFRKQVRSAGINSLSREHRRLFRLGRQLASQGMTVCS